MVERSVDDQLDEAGADDDRIDRLADLMERRLAEMQADYERTIALGGVGYTGPNIDHRTNADGEHTAVTSDDDAPYSNGAPDGYEMLGNGAPVGYAALGSDDEGSEADGMDDSPSLCYEGAEPSDDSQLPPFQPPPRLHSANATDENASAQDSLGAQAADVNGSLETQSGENSSQPQICANSESKGVESATSDSQAFGGAFGSSADTTTFSHLENFADFDAFPATGEIESPVGSTAKSSNWPSVANEHAVALDENGQKDAQMIRETMQRIKPAAPEWAGKLTDDVLQRMIQDAMRFSDAPP